MGEDGSAGAGPRRAFSEPARRWQDRGRSRVVADGPAQRRSTAGVLSGRWDDRCIAVTHRRVALVTGSSRGLGAAIARRLALDDFAVAVNSSPGDEQVAAVSRSIGVDGGVAGGLFRRCHR
jgi:hypothetical protein